MLCFRKLPVAKKFMDKRAGEVLRFSVEKILSQGAENLRGGTLLCVIISGYRESLNERVGVGVYQDFSSKTCLSHSDEKFRWATLYCVIIFGVSKNFMLHRLCHVSPSKLFCLTVPRSLVGEPFCAVFSKIPVAKKFMDKRVGEL